VAKPSTEKTFHGEGDQMPDQIMPDQSQDEAVAFDAWGEPLPPPSHSGTGRHWRRWVLIGGAGVLLIAIGGVFHALRQAVIHSLAQDCRAAMHGEDWELLDQLGARYRRWSPFTAEPFIFLAESAYRRGALERAVHLLDLLPDNDPMTPPAILVQSSILFGPLNRPIRGAEVLERAVRLDPRNAEARRRLIFFYAFSLQRRKMVQHAYEAIRWDCDSPEVYVYLVARDWLSFSNAYAENSRWSLNNPDEELFLVSRAIYRVLTKGLDYSDDPIDQPVGDDGVPYHRQVLAGYLEQFPENLELLVFHLEMAQTQGDIDEMVRLLSRAPATAAEDNRFWRFKGWVHSTRGELADAEAAYQQALKLNPYDYRSQHQLAVVERSLRRFDRVERLENLSQQGTTLRRDILVMERVDLVPHDILQRIAAYAEAVGDVMVATKLRERFLTWGAQQQGLTATLKTPPRASRFVPEATWPDDTDRDSRPAP
jgi:tetratricopeptide (TPR) repeat protein